MTFQPVFILLWKSFASPGGPRTGASQGFHVQPQITSSMNSCLCLTFNFQKYNKHSYKNSFLFLTPGLYLSLLCGFSDSHPIYASQFPTKIETRPQVNSLSLFLQTSSPLPPPPFKAEAQGNEPGDKLIFTKASPDNSDTSHVPRGGMLGLNTHEDHVLRVESILYVLSVESSVPFSSI